MQLNEDEESLKAPTNLYGRKGKSILRHKLSRHLAHNPIFNTAVA
jgi:hypothetical protein